MQWHDIEKDPPPTPNEKYIVCGVEKLPFDVTYRHVAILKYGANGCFYQQGYWSRYRITHWMPLPKPPEVEE